jgi:hypothetical protein
VRKARQCLLLFEAAGTLQLAQGGGAVAAHQLERGCRRGGLGDGSFEPSARAASIWSTRCRASLSRPRRSRIDTESAAAADR